jgi:hypothetical protein
MADKKKEKEKSKATIRGTVSSPTKDQAEFPPMPPESQLNDRFEKLMGEMGYPEEIRKQMRAFTPDKKWMLVCQEQHRDKMKVSTPESVINKLKDNATRSDMEQLVIFLTKESVSWVLEFIERKGVELLGDILEKTLNKPVKGDGEKDIITQCILSFKGVFRQKEGFEVVKQTKSFVELILKSYDYVSSRTKIMILNFIAVLSLVDVEIHRSSLAKILPYVDQLLLTLQSESVDMKIAGLTCINALVIAEGHESPDKDTLLQTLMERGLKRFVRNMKKPNIPDALETQIEVFEDGIEHDADSEEQSKFTVSAGNPEEAFNKVREQLKGTPLYNVFGNILSHLLMVRRTGKPGATTWDVLADFVEVMASTDKDLTSRIELAKTVSDRLLQKLGGRGDDADMGGAPPPPPPPGMGAPPPPPPPGGAGDDSGAPPPPPPPGGDGGPPPPPPPPGGAGGPPPPPPPPGGAGGPPPPPPPGGPKAPGAPAPAQPKKKTIVPGTKMRQFNWNKLAPNKVANTIWSKLDDEKVRINPKVLEDLFCAAKPKPPSEHPGEADGAAKQVKAQVINLLDMKRSQNISIMLSRLSGMSNEDIKKAIVNMDAEKISLETLQIMVLYIPQPEEMEMLKEYKGDVTANLGKAERYFLTIMDIQQLEAKLTAWEFQRSFESKMAVIKESLSTIGRTLKDIKSNQNLPKVLEYILAVGNYINGSTARGGAFGFKLNSLLRMLDVKSAVDDKLSLLHFVVQEFEHNNPSVANLADEFPTLETASRENMTMLAGDLNKLKGGFSKCDGILKNPNSDPKFKEAVSRFLTDAQAAFDTAQKQLEQYQKELKETLTYFAEDNMESDEFFGLLYQFVFNFEKCKKDLARKKALEEKAKQAEERKKNMVANKKGPGMGTQSPNALEDMLSELASGNAFSKQSASARRQSIMVGKAPQPAMQPEFLLKKLKPTGGDNQPPKEANTTSPGTLNLPKLNHVGAAKTGSGDVNGKTSPRDATTQPQLSPVKPSTPKQAATPTPAPVKQAVAAESKPAVATTAPTATPPPTSPTPTAKTTAQPSLTSSQSATSPKAEVKSPSADKKKDKKEKEKKSKEKEKKKK